MTTQKTIVPQFDRNNQPLTRTQQKEVDAFVGSLSVERVIDMVAQLVVMLEPVGSPIHSTVRRSPPVKSVRKAQPKRTSVKQTKKS